MKDSTKFDRNIKTTSMLSRKNGFESIQTSQLIQEVQSIDTEVQSNLCAQSFN